MTSLTLSNGSTYRLLPDSGPSQPLEPHDDPFRPESRETNALLQHAENNPFAFTPEILSKMFSPKSLPTFHALGGLAGLVHGLRTDYRSGLSVDETVVDRRNYSTFQSNSPAASDLYVDRKRVFGVNRLPERKPKSICQLMWIAFNDKVLILLATVATISLSLGLYQTFALPHKPGQPRVEWAEGVTIMAAVIIVVVVGALNDYQKELQFARLHRKKDDRVVRAIRSGRSLEISVYDILVGDVLHLEPGDLVPADGVLISGYNVRCDESSATGESDPAHKIGGDEAMTRIAANQGTHKLDPFILSGSKVLEGIGTYLVTGVGMHSSYGKLMVSMAEETDSTPLQKKLGVVADQIATAGVAVALVLFVVLFSKFLAQLPGSTDSPYEKGQTFLRILISSLTVVVVAVPEGLPLAVTLALAIATTKMLKDNNLVRVLSACETMGNATSVCCDKTGTLTENKMKVRAGILGTSSQFKGSTTTIEEPQVDSSPLALRPGLGSVNEFVSSLPDDVRKILVQSIVINSTAFESEEGGQTAFVGSKTEAALLLFAKELLGIGPLSQERDSVAKVQVIPFDSNRKCMATVTRNSKFSYCLYVKGAPEILLDKCTHVIADPTKSADGVSLTGDKIDLLTGTIGEYGASALRTIGLAYREFRSWPPPEAQTLEGDSMEVLFEDIFQNMTFLGLFGIQDPLRPDAKEAVEQCQRAGIFVRMVTGDNVGTAKAIARECSILTPEGIVMEGPHFRALSPMELKQCIPRLQVLARSSPEDKMVLVKTLKELGEIVAVTGDGTNDGPALRAADVGFSMGISGTEVAKEASLIILMNDNFSSIVKAVSWGRTVNDAVRKFLQFQLTVNITAVTLVFVSAIASEKEESILTPVQLLWVNLIMDTFAALALATDPPTPEILNRKPTPKSAPLISVTMWKMIVGQSIYQLVVTLVLNFAGDRILGYYTGQDEDTLETLVFNTFVWMQFFNQYNNRRLDNNLNIFEGLHRNYYYISINLVTILGQLLIIFFGGGILSATRLNGTQWAISLFLGALSLPIAVVIRLIPDDFIARNFPIRVDRNLTARIDISFNRRSIWNEAAMGVREELVSFRENRSFSFLNGKTIFGREAAGEREGEGGHLGIGTKGVVGRSRSNSALAPAAVMAGMVMGSVAALSVPNDT